MRRLVSRVISPLLLAVIVLSCTDSLTSLDRGAVRIALLPQFSAQAQTIYKNLSAFAVTLDNVHIVVRVAATGDALGPVLKDTTVAFPATANQITIELDLRIQGSQQDVVATVELREGATAYFSGTQDFVAKLGETATAPQPVDMRYAGPGATAAFISISPQPATLAPSASFQFTAQVFDAQEQPVSGLPLTWSTSDATVATVSQTGVVTSTAKVGLTTLVVTGLNGVTGQATVNVQPVVRLAVIGGDNQTGIAGAALPTKMQVQAFDANGNAVIGATINFAAVGGGGVSPASATTDVNGVASTTMTLGSLIGTFAFTATLAASPNVTVRVAASVTAGAAAALGVLGGSNQVDTVLATLGKPLSVKLTDAFGNPVSQQAIDFQVTSGQATLIGVPGTPAQTLVHTSTDNTGTAQATLVAGTLAGAVIVTATAPQTSIAPVTFAATLRPGVPKLLAVIQQPSATAQATITLGKQPRVQVTDQYGNAVALAGLTILVNAQVDCALRACGRVVPPGRTGPSLNRTRLGPASATTTVRLSVPTTIAKTQSISDTFPRGLGGVTEVKTDANGVAAFSNLVLNLSVGPWQLQFADTATALTPALSNDIQLSPGPAASIIAWGVFDTTFIAIAGAALTPSVRVIDEVGNGVPGVGVTWSIPAAFPDNLATLGSSSIQTDGNGVAAPGQWIIPASATGLPLVFHILATAQLPGIENSPLTLTAQMQ